MPEFDRSEPVTVALHLAHGRADLIAEDRTTVVADVVAVDGSDPGAVVTLEGDTLVVRAPDGPGRRRTPRLAVTVRVPTGSSLAATTAAADLHATGRFATARVTSASGDTTIEEITGDGHLEAASGDLTLGRAGGALRAGSSSGAIDIGDVTGDVSAEAASGDITIRAAGASADVRTASGDVRIGVLRRGRARIRAVSGDVSVGVAAGTGVWLDVSTTSGDTRNELAMGASAPDADAATLELGVRTVSGDIEIRRAAAPYAAAA